MLSWPGIHQLQKALCVEADIVVVGFWTSNARLLQVFLKLSNYQLLAI